MAFHICERCGMEFTQKKHLVQHLKRKNPCLALKTDKLMSELLDDLKKQKVEDGVKCSNCEKYI